MTPTIKCPLCGNHPVLLDDGKTYSCFVITQSSCQCEHLLHQGVLITFEPGGVVRYSVDGRPVTEEEIDVARQRDEFEERMRESGGVRYPRKLPMFPSFGRTTGGISDVMLGETPFPDPEPDPPVHPVEVMERMARLFFPDREIDQGALKRLRSFCDEPVSQKACPTCRWGTRGTCDNVSFPLFFSIGTCAHWTAK